MSKVCVEHEWYIGRVVSRVESSVTNNTKLNMINIMKTMMISHVNLRYNDDDDDDDDNILSQKTTKHPSTYCERSVLQGIVKMYINIIISFWYHIWH